MNRTRTTRTMPTSLSTPKAAPRKPPSGLQPIPRLPRNSAGPLEIERPPLTGGLFVSLDSDRVGPGLRPGQAERSSPPSPHPPQGATVILPNVPARLLLGPAVKNNWLIPPFFPAP